LLWCGDSPTAPTGFGRVTQNVLSQLRQDWAVGVLGINYEGDPHQYPYPIYPAILGGDLYGLRRFGTLAERTRPDVIVILNDTWIAARFAEIPVEAPLVAYMPVDAPNQPDLSSLNRLAHAVFYTEFGIAEARRAGYTGPATVIPHGVDTGVYRPVERGEALERLGLRDKLPPDVVIIGNVNRNQPRKRLDLTIRLFARWVDEYQISSNVRLLLHCARQDIGPDLAGLAQYYGVRDRLIWTNPHNSSMTGIAEELMPCVYGVIDIQVTTTLGEGWGLTTHEGMACGVPQLAPDWSALGEWARGAAVLVPVTGHHGLDGVPTIGGVVDEGRFVKELDRLYRHREYRAFVGDRCLERAREPRFQWTEIGRQFDAVLRGVTGGRDEFEGFTGEIPAPVAAAG
jgi:D-inositol-3-phosphate glycosyltransferase